MIKNVLVTGASRGMGQATANLLCKEGYFVYGVFKTGEKVADGLKKELKNIEIFQCNFAKREETEKLIQKLKDVRLSGIVNCAGIFLPMDFDNFDINLWDETMETNLVAPLLLVQGLKDNLEDGASIVNIASTDGMIGATSGIAYAASKAALINLTVTFANHFAKRKIRANAIAPGWIGDGMNSPKELLKEAAELNPLKRIGSYEEIAQVISFLLSEKSSYINGTTITVDGGDNATNYILQREAKLVQ